jgi:hypothetical protein
MHTQEIINLIVYLYAKEPTNDRSKLLDLLDQLVHSVQIQSSTKQDQTVVEKIEDLPAGFGPYIPDEVCEHEFEEASLEYANRFIVGKIKCRKCSEYILP